ncbi:hypothetical protein [Mucilaginibacter jinjuensis]|uniref:Uncharacterized protein n=1 Tax=Mucilaginibacter jinjuensis TaxID=1176721 RepID=A0ABY7T665_9SPHI|nr:hypothetical protein [Mucilaginibacter jinjuensis]WCT11969.1 hypothetical protein PQO05_24865 [Mucilaginibacter jinjuensis]
MEWYQYLAAFFAGAFLANTVPHFVKGICGDKFPTPFAKPPGKGLSSPTTNVIWALANLVIGYLLLGKGNINNEHPAALITCFIGIAAMGIMLSIRFQSKDKE